MITKEGATWLLQEFFRKQATENNLVLRLVQNVEIQYTDEYADLIFTENVNKGAIARSADDWSLVSSLPFGIAMESKQVSFEPEGTEDPTGVYRRAALVDETNTILFGYSGVLAAPNRTIAQGDAITVKFTVVLR